MNVMGLPKCLALKKGSLPATIALTWALLLALLHGCANPRSSEETTFTHVQSLKPLKKSTALKAHGVLDEKALFSPVCFLILEGHLLVHDQKADAMIQVFDLDDGQREAAFGGKGQGPEEFDGPWQIFPGHEPGSFWVFDLTPRQVKLYDLQEVLAGKTEPHKILTLALQPTQLVCVWDDHFIAAGLFPDGRLARLSMSDGSDQGRIGRLPVAEPGPYAEAVAHAHAFLGFPAFDPQSEQIMLATRLGGIVERYSLNGELLATLLGPQAFYPIYELDEAQGVVHMVKTAKTRMGYLDICFHAPSKTFYLLYSGELWRPKREGSMGQTILALQANGALVEQFLTETGFFDIETGEDGSLYAMNEEGIFRLARQP